VDNSCEFGIEPLGSIKCWETILWPNIYWLSSSAQLHRVCQLVSWEKYVKSTKLVIVLHTSRIPGRSAGLDCLFFFFTLCISF
jgi:hypothetical protein